MTRPRCPESRRVEVRTGSVRHSFLLPPCRRCRPCALNGPGEDPRKVHPEAFRKGKP